MTGHTKRTEAFRIEIMELANDLQREVLTREQRERLIDILGRNTVDNPSIVKARENEPIFVLRAHDSTSSSLVGLWCERFRTWIANATLTPHAEASAMAKWKDAMECASEMREYKDQKLPD